MEWKDTAEADLTGARLVWAAAGPGPGTRPETPVSEPRLPKGGGVD